MYITAFSIIEDSKRVLGFLEIELQNWEFFVLSHLSNQIGVYISVACEASLGQIFSWNCFYSQIKVSLIIIVNWKHFLSEWKWIGFISASCFFSVPLVAWHPNVSPLPEFATITTAQLVKVGGIRCVNSRDKSIIHFRNNGMLRYMVRFIFTVSSSKLVFVTFFFKIRRILEKNVSEAIINYSEHKLAAFFIGLTNEKCCL